MPRIDNYPHDSPAFTIALEQFASNNDDAGYLLDLQRQYEATESYKLATGLAKFALVDPQLRFTNNTFVSLSGMTLGIRFEQEEIHSANWDEQLAERLQVELADSLPVLGIGEIVTPYSERVLFAQELGQRINHVYRTDVDSMGVAYETAHNLYPDEEERRIFLFGYGAIRALAG